MNQWQLILYLRPIEQLMCYVLPTDRSSS